MNRKTRLAVAIGGAVIVFGLAACGDNAGGDSAAPPVATSPAATGTPTSVAVDQVHNEADTEFAQMMIIHHKGAIEMADLAVQKASTDKVRSLAEGISAAQGPEIETMTSWLEVWGENTSPAPGDGDMGGMGHDGMDMDGMDQAQAMSHLQSLSGTEFDRRFLELMTAHHQGAIMMARAQLAEGENPQAKELAQKIIGDQQIEIEEMKQMLQDF